MPDAGSVSDAVRKSRREAIWQAVVSWGMAILLFAVVQLLRSRFVDMFQSLDPEEIRPSFISFAEPNKTGIGFTWGHLYRLMHNLTVPYIMAFYVAAFIGAFALFRRKGRAERAQFLFEVGCIVIHMAFLAAWATSLFMPEEVFGDILSAPMGP